MPTKEIVSIVKVKEQDLDGAVRQAVALLGNIDEIIPARSRVLVKPNFVFAPTDVGITHPSVIEAIVRLVAETNPQEIIIAEGSADVYTSQSFRVLGLYGLAHRYGARLVDLNLEEGVRTEVPPGLGRDYIMLPRVVTECDVFISVPIFKLWGDSPLSLSLKNLIGLYGGRYYGYNKASRERVKECPEYGLPGEVGTEPGAHVPSVKQSIAALNSIVRTDLSIIDALEGGDGQGNWIALDLLIAGRNPVGTDTVALAVAGEVANEHPTFSYCAQRGLGPCELSQIEVRGERIEEVQFNLKRLRSNILEMPVEYCLERLSTGELEAILRAFQIYGLLPSEAEKPQSRDELAELLRRRMSESDFYPRALGCLNIHARTLLELIIQRGGTSGNALHIRREYGQITKESPYLYFAPSSRALTRLGLAYIIQGMNRSYYLLPAGLTAALRKS